MDDRVHWFWWLFWAVAFWPALIVVAIVDNNKRKQTSAFDQEAALPEDNWTPTPAQPAWLTLLVCAIGAAVIIIGVAGNYDRYSDSNPELRPMSRPSNP